MRRPKLTPAQEYWLTLERERSSIKFNTFTLREKMIFDAGRYREGARDRNAVNAAKEIGATNE